MNILKTIKAVLWSFIGIRKNTEFQKDAQQLNPLTIIITGIILTIIFILTLIFIINVIVL